MAHWQINIDTGGTFTDCLAKDPGGKEHRLKVLSNGTLKAKIQEQQGSRLRVTSPWQGNKVDLSGYRCRIPKLNFETLIQQNGADWLELAAAPNEAEGLDLELGAGEEAPILACRLLTGVGLKERLPEIDLRLGTTKGTNALLEHKGTPPLLIITKGFKDLARIGSQEREDLFALEVRKRAVYHGPVFEVKEEIDAQGNIQQAWPEEDRHALIDYCRKKEIKNAAVVTLNAYKNNHHEKGIAEALKESGLSYISCSTELSRSIHFQQRGETTIVNAYLRPLMDQYLGKIKEQTGSLKVMTSAGGLMDDGSFNPKDGLFSGPAGGIVAASHLAQRTQSGGLITFDMGGTSTDVARYSEHFDYHYQSRIGDALVVGPALNIHTVAAGGGSICAFDGERFTVGPESGGAQPGPASYGLGGPLCITDIHLLMGRLALDRFSIPLDINAAETALKKLLKQEEQDQKAVLQGFLDIANEKMAEAIRKISTAKGYDPTEHALLAFGGAGGMHACAVADILQIERVILPADAGILSAYGISKAREERFAEQEVLGLLKDVQDFKALTEETGRQAQDKLHAAGYAAEEVGLEHVFAYLRLKGQEHELEIDCLTKAAPAEAFEAAYRRLYGHYIEDRPIELVRLKAIARVKGEAVQPAELPDEAAAAEPLRKKKALVGGAWQEIAVYDYQDLRPGQRLLAPAIIMYNTSTAFLESGWTGRLDNSGNIRAEKDQSEIEHQGSSPEAIQLELFSNRFTAIAEEMGALLQRTAFSVNIKERLDFSCALLDAQGKLIVNAPHIPVHLGALGHCVRQVKQALDLQEGDVAIVNSPAFGGSHLPDVTLIAPIYHQGQRVAFAANRAHHAEIGGVAPGSMPARAENLAQEGVVIDPMLLVKDGEVRWSSIKDLLSQAPHPTRALSENLADLNAALASLEQGKRQMKSLFEQHGAETVQHYMTALKHYAHRSLWKALARFDRGTYTATERLDDGTRLQVEIELAEDLSIDLRKSDDQHSGNLNANPAIVHSVVLYVLRLIAREAIPLNEGLLEAVDIKLRQGSLLNPVFHKDPSRSPAVVGGNVELSQRLTDTLLKAFRLAGCSQGTMNNVLFGNEDFGFYETICGGTGAGEGFSGADAVHQHMTNTRITDAEVMEFRYPVRVEEFSIRKDSGGQGQWSGGNGVRRRLRFKAPVQLTVLTQHREEAPYGMQGGHPGAKGKQKILRQDGREEPLDHLATVALKAGDRFEIETPGGGGFG